MIFTRSDFYQHIFEPYNQAVKNGKYVKIEYRLWRTLRDWCCDEQWHNFEIVVDPINDGYNFYLRDDLRITPEVITIARTAKKDFTKYLEDKVGDYWQFDLKFQEKLNEQLTAVSNSVSYCYDADVCTIDSSTQYGICYYDASTLNPPITVKEKENDNMKFNFDFGPVDSSVRMSLYGMAIKNASGTYVAYDSNSKQIMDVEVVNFDGANKFVYKMPAAIKDIAVGDVIIHSRKPMFVQELHKDNRLKVLDVYDGEEKVIVPAVSPFGFNFVTKVVNFLGNLNTGADASNPFGNLGLMLALSDKGGNDMLPLMLMAGGKMDMSNPLMLYALMGKDNNINDMLPWMLMCRSPALPSGGCGNCECHCQDK